jgi:diguanylate cyclase (GGDEF)-like protein
MDDPGSDPLHLVLFNLPTPVFVIDRDGRSYYANRAAVELLGTGVDPSAGPEDLAECYQAKVFGTDEPYPSSRMPIVRALYGETSTVDDMVIARPDGDILISVTGAPIFGRDGQVAFAVASFRNISRERQLEMHAFRDDLTGLQNRRSLDRDLAAALRRIERTHAPLGILFIDIDNFKRINDEWGHPVGDQVLVEAGRRIRGMCRRVETPYRYGGDEFVVICENLSGLGDIQAIGERVRNALGGEYDLKGRRLAVHVSVGAAATDSAATPPARLLAEADATMYGRKGPGE